MREQAILPIIFNRNEAKRFDTIELLNTNLKCPVSKFKLYRDPAYDRKGFRIDKIEKAFGVTETVKVETINEGFIAQFNGRFYDVTGQILVLRKKVN